MKDAGWTTTGLDVTNSYGIHFDPFDTKRLFITYTDIGLFRSEDGGASWMSSTTGVPREWLNTTYWIVFDPKVKGRMWSVNSGTHDLPRPKMWRHNSVINYKGGVVRQRRWRQDLDANRISGMDETGATHILLDPTSPRGCTRAVRCRFRAMGSTRARMGANLELKTGHHAEGTVRLETGARYQWHSVCADRAALRGWQHRQRRRWRSLQVDRWR